MSFTPSLATTTYVPLPIPSASSTSSRQSITLNFTYTTPSSSQETQSTVEPQVWTNLPSRTTSSREWHAVPFVPSEDRALDGLLVATFEIPLEGEQREQEEYEFTYRLKHDGNEENLEWLGSQGANGKIILVKSDENGSRPIELQSHNVEGEWTKEERGKVLVGRYETREGETSSSYDVTKIVETWRNGAEVEGLTLEQSSRTWFTPRPFPLSSSPLSHLSTKFVSQLVLLRTIPSAQSPTERLLVVFPFCSAGTNSSLTRSRSEDGTLLVRCERDSLEDKTKGGIVFVSGSSEGFDSLVKTAVETARSCLYPSTTSSTSSGTPDLPRRDPKDLTLCTWNALGQEFTLSQLLEWSDKMLSPSNTTQELIESFKRGGLMLDDGWQDTGIFEGSCWGDPLKGLKGYGLREGWYDIEGGGANKEEEGWELKDAVRGIREKGIEKIGVWITITGYWHCLHPDFSPELETTLATFSSPQHDNYEYTSRLPTISTLRRFFSTYFTRIRSAGISFIKIDNQALVDSLVSLSDGTDPGSYRAKLVSVVQEESARTFGTENVTHCMAHSTRLWSGPFALSPSSSTSSSKPTLRNSDDFFPHEIDSHRWHVYINSINLLLTKRLERFDPDIDMAMERHEFGSYHLALRGFSTAGVWSTDSMTDEKKEGEGRLGEEKRGWKGLMAQTKKRGTKVLQAREEPGSVLSSQVLSRRVTGREEGGEALKVGLGCGRARGGTIGLWNCQKEGSVQARLTKRDVLDLFDDSAPKEDLVLFVNEAFGPDTSSSTPPFVTTITPDSLKTDQALPESLSLPIAAFYIPSRAVQIATIAELHEIENSKGNSTLRVACLGLRDKFVGLEAIRRIHVAPPERRIKEPKRAKASQETLSIRSKPTLPSLPSHSPRSISPKSTFPTPPPGTHLPFLLTYFSNLFVPRQTSSSSSSSSTSSPTRTASTELSSLFKSLLRRPFSTFLTEVREIFTFGIAVVVWAFKSRKGGGGGGGGNGNIGGSGVVADVKGLEEGTKKKKKNEEEVEVEPPTVVVQVEEEEEEEPESTKEVLRVELEFASSQLAFYFSPSLSTVEDVSFKLDRRAIDGKYVNLNGEGGIVEVDVEGFWKDGGSKVDGIDADTWILEVACK